MTEGLAGGENGGEHEEEGDDDDVDWRASFSGSGGLMGRVAVTGLSKGT